MYQAVKDLRRETYPPVHYRCVERDIISVPVSTCSKDPIRKIDSKILPDDDIARIMAMIDADSARAEYDNYFAYFAIVVALGFVMISYIK